jgi:putative endonuclease
MSLSYDLGKNGELQAIEFLKQKGYVIRAINWRYRYKELDIVADFGNELHVIEVKTRTSALWQTGNELVGRRKQKNIIDAAEAYVILNGTDKNVVFDIIYILDTGTGCKIELISDAFSACESGNLN